MLAYHRYSCMNQLPQNIPNGPQESVSRVNYGRVNQLSQHPLANFTHILGAIRGHFRKFVENVIKRSLFWCKKFLHLHGLVDLR